MRQKSRTRARRRARRTPQGQAEKIVKILWPLAFQKAIQTDEKTHGLKGKTNVPRR